MVNLHIIGVQKAGTTALARFLSQHPSIYVVDGKEAHVFDHPQFAKQTDKTAFANNIYQSKLTNYDNQSIVCDATPITVYRPEFIQACYQYKPDAKFILILRDPVERAISHYHMSYRRDQEERSMLAAFLLEPLRLRDINKSSSWKFDSPFRNHSYLSRGCYSKQLRYVYGIIPKEQLLVLHQEDLKNQHDSVMLKIFEFLNISPMNITASQVFISEKTNVRRSDILARLYARLYFFIRRENRNSWDKIINP